MRLIKRFNALLHPLMRMYLRMQYAKKLGVYKKLHPEAFKSANAVSRAKHKALWGKLVKRVNTGWLDVFYGISGNDDYRFVPEDIFYGVIERCLNNCNGSGGFIEDKNDVYFYIPKKYQPRTVLHYERGMWFDEDFAPLTISDANKVISSYSELLVGKPTMFTSGGSNVRTWNSNEIDLNQIEDAFDGYLFQKRLKQDIKVSAFNPASINTCRIMTFRRPWNAETSVIAAMLRLGCGNEITDNLSLGGVCVDIDNNGRLADFAVDHRFGRYKCHPQSKIAFSGFEIPQYKEMCNVVCEIAAKIPGFNLLSFDVINQDNGEPCVIEINATSMAMARLQTMCPLFGDETEQVVEWCAEHRKFDYFNHLRTWY